MDAEVEMPYGFYTYKSLYEQCEAGVEKFSNDQMSRALCLVEPTWKLLGVCKAMLKAIEDDRHRYGETQPEPILQAERDMISALALVEQVNDD